MASVEMIKETFRKKLVNIFGHELIGQMSQLSFLSSFTYQNMNSEKVMDGLLLLKPENTGIILGAAVSKLVVHKYGEVQELLEYNLLAAQPDNMEAMCFLGASKIKNNDKEAGTILLKKVIENGGESIKKVAESYLKSAR